LAASLATTAIALAQQNLSPQEKRGKQIFLTGTSASGKPIVARLGEDSVEVPASALPCASCHGYDGRGNAEGGVAPSNITWEALTKPYTVAMAGGRQRPPYNESSIRSAIAMGFDPAGNSLNPAMPRYAFSREDMADLIAYLKRLGTELDPGLSKTAIRIGTVLPDRGPLAELGAEVREVLDAYFSEVNASGGLYDRKLELHVLPLVPGPAASQRFQEFLAQDEIFALVTPFTAGMDAAAAEIVEDRQVPTVGALTLYPQIRIPVGRYFFYLLAGLPDQARAMLDYAAGNLSQATREVVLIAPEGEALESIGTALSQKCEKVGCGWLERIGYRSAAFAPAEVLARFRRTDGQLCFFFGTGTEARALLDTAAQFGWRPYLFLSGSLVGSEVWEAPDSFRGRIVMAYPMAPAEQTPAALQEFQELVRRHNLTTKHVAFQLSALAAAKTLVEALRRAGRDVSREKLVETLEGFYKYETGLVPPVTFGPNQRIGAPEVYVVTADLEKRQLIVALRWSPPY
jgi:ABC-type branched-subunit amino acid transport system substrate-binding protein